MVSKKDAVGTFASSLAGFISTVVASKYLPNYLFIPVAQSVNHTTVYTNIVPLGVGAGAKLLATRGKKSNTYVNAFGDGALIAGVGLPVFYFFFK